MNIIVERRHAGLPDDIRAYAEEKVEKVGRFLNHGMVLNVEVELFTEKNPSIDSPQVVEITMYTKGPVMRAREASHSMHAAIDLACDKLERQARKLHGKIVDKHTKPENAVVPPELQGFRPPLTPDEEEAADSEFSGAIVKRKKVELKPMSHHEAIEQLELLNHDFFIFGSETGEMNVLYRRRDGDYGLIEPRYS